MTPSMLLAIAAVVLLAALVAWTIPLLVQLRRTARTMEETLRDTAPQLRSAATNLNSVLGKADRVLQGMEDGTRGLSGALDSIATFARAAEASRRAPAGFPIAGWLALAWKVASGVMDGFRAARGAASSGAGSDERPQGGSARE